MVEYHKPKSDWSNGDDMGKNGTWLGLKFVGIKTPQTISMVLREGGAVTEYFSVKWEQVAASHTTGARTSITSAIVSDTNLVPRLIVKNESPEPNLSPPERGADLRYDILMVEFEARAGMINYGFDPKETVREDGPYPWASVDKDDESSVSKILIEPESIADQVELVVVSGGSSADIDPKTFTASSTDLTITGQGAAGNALVEARIGSSGPVCSKLNIMALPKRSLTVGIYYIEDSSSSGTSPVGGPSASAVVDVLNDVFSQAQIEFTLIESETVDIDYDDNQNGKLDEDEIDALVATPFWSGQVNGMFVRESGIPYPSDTNFMVRGVHLHEASGGVLCTVNIGSYASLGIAHEIGHELFLATHNDDGGGHDAGPWPDGEESLMRSGSPVNGVLPNPGRWLRHEDWKTANDEAANQ